MLAVANYTNLLQTDIPALLDNSLDRTNALDEHISLLKNYYNRTLERLTIIGEQIADLSGIIAESNNNTK